MRRARWALLLLAGTVGAAQGSVQERGFIDLADGVRLNYVLTRPEGPGPFPVALTYGPYAESYVTTSALPHYPLETWLAEGYAHLSVGFRGTGCSGGTFGEFGSSGIGNLLHPGKRRACPRSCFAASTAFGLPRSPSRVRWCNCSAPG